MRAGMHMSSEHVTWNLQPGELCVVDSHGCSVHNVNSDWEGKLVVFEVRSLTRHRDIAHER